MLVRRLVSGVRSSCPASATSCRCRSLRRVQGEQHLVERRGQPGQLVVAGDLDRVQLGRASDALGGGGEAAHRTQAVGGDHPAGAAGQHHAGRTGEEQDDLEPLEGALDRLHRLGEHERRSLAGLHGDDAVRLAVDAWWCGASSSACPIDTSISWLLSGRVASSPRRLKIWPPRTTKILMPATSSSSRGRCVVGVDGGVGPAEHRLVERALELRAHRDEHERAHGREGDGDRGRGQQGDPHRERRAGRQRLDVPMDGAERRSDPPTGGAASLMAASRAGRNRRRARCAAAGPRPRPRACAGRTRRRPPASWPWSGSRSPRPPRG